MQEEIPFKDKNSLTNDCYISNAFYLESSTVIMVYTNANMFQNTAVAAAFAIITTTTTR